DRSFCRVLTTPLLHRTRTTGAGPMNLCPNSRADRVVGRIARLGRPSSVTVTVMPDDLGPFNADFGTNALIAHWKPQGAQGFRAAAASASGSGQAAWISAESVKSFEEKLEAPPGFEPGVEVLQISQGWLSC